MGDLSDHFSRAEFACRCGCGLNNVSPRLIAKLEELRALIGRPIRITSGLRCERHNAATPGSASKSTHTTGLGCDIAVVDMPYPDLVAACNQVFATGGVGTYPRDRHVHVDVRTGGPYRWQA